jgi:hypothetical protein
MGVSVNSEDLGLPFDTKRIRYLEDKYRPILDQIRKLREIELKDVYPAVFFDPMRPYKEDMERPK